jgi:hypothetical protein
LTTTQTLDEYASRQVQSLQGNESQVAFSNPRSVQMGGLDGRETSGTVTTENPPRLQRVAMTVKAPRAYALYYTGPTDGRYPQIFQTMLDSFAFLP